MSRNYDRTYSSKAQNDRERFLILHYTAMGFSDSLAALMGPNVSSHYLVPTLKTIDPSYPHNELRVYSLVPEDKRAWHAGVSSWQTRVNLNDSSIGIEIVNKATDEEFQPYPDEQLGVVIELCKDILSRFPDITPANVLGHSDIAIGRKKDPGPLFPWKALYDAGIGAWFDQSTVNEYITEFTRHIPSEEEVAKKLHEYGYGKDCSIKDLLSAFQMHFRPSDYRGELDPETAAVAYALHDKYITKVKKEEKKSFQEKKTEPHPSKDIQVSSTLKPLTEKLTTSNSKSSSSSTLLNDQRLETESSLIKSGKGQEFYKAFNEGLLKLNLTTQEMEILSRLKPVIKESMDKAYGETQKPRGIATKTHSTPLGASQDSNMRI